MKKTIPLKKDIPFKSVVSQIVSIALDEDFHLEDKNIKGNLTISGSYKMNDVSVNTEDFSYDIPVNIELNDRYVLDNLKISVDDFYYELIDNNILSVNVELGLNNLEEISIKNEPEVLEKLDTKLSDTDRNDEETILDNFNVENDNYCSYKVYMVKENDTIESIMVHYKVTRDLLEQYNDISDIKLGDKLIIPYVFDETN